jgi:hypothetical protein
MTRKMLPAMVVTVLFAFAPCTHASDVADGQWWNRQSPDQKVIYAAGFFDGMNYAAKLFSLAMLIAQDDPKTKAWSLQRTRILAAAENIAIDQLNSDFKNLTTAQLAAGLNKVYEDDRNTRIRAQDAVAVVVRIMSGSSDEEIRKLLEQLRRDATK